MVLGHAPEIPGTDSVHAVYFGIWYMTYLNCKTQSSKCFYDNRYYQDFVTKSKLCLVIFGHIIKASSICDLSSDCLPSI